MPSHAKRRPSTPKNGRVIYLHSRGERDRQDDDDELPNPRLSKGKRGKGGRRGMAGQTTVNCAPAEAKVKESRGMNKWVGIFITGAVSAVGAIVAYRAWNRWSGSNAQTEMEKARNNPALPVSTMNPVTANAMNMLMATSASPATNQQIAMNAMQIQQAQLLEQSKLQLMALEAQSKLKTVAAPKKRKKKALPMAASLDALLQGPDDDDDDDEEEEDE